jgi:hypothetical protein
VKQQISSNLQPIYDLELALGNTVAWVHNSGPAALPLTVVFTTPLHRKMIESRITIAPPVKWYSVGNFGGYISEDTRQSVQGPMPDAADLAQDARDQLCPSLQPIYELELALGNTVARVDEPAGSLCSLAIVFENPLHKSEVESSLSLSSKVKWWESRDPHYPIEAGYKCEETTHVIAGPPR